MKQKIISFLVLFLILLSNFSYGIFTPNIYKSDDNKIIAYSELNAATITLPSGKRIQSTNVNGNTNMDIQEITAPLEIVLVIDISSSMITNGRMGSAKTSAKTLVENLFNVAQSIQVSLIAFNSRAFILVNSSNDKNAILGSIDSLRAAGSTNMLPAIQSAETIFKKISSSNTYSFLVCLTDGKTQNSEECAKKLSTLEKNGVYIYNILLQTISDEAFYIDGIPIGTIYEDISPEELASIYDEIYFSICQETIVNTVDDFIENAQNYFVADDNLFMFLDQELLQGCLLEVEYIINIKTAFPCTKLELKDVVDKKFNFNPSSSLISEEKTNADYGWEIDEQLSHKKGNGLILSLTESSEEDPDKDYIIKKGGSYEVKLLLSCLLTTKEDANYTNSLTFRLKNGDQPDNISNWLETKSMEVNIIPPFGQDQNLLTKFIIFTILIIIIIFLIFYSKKIVRK